MIDLRQRISLAQDTPTAASIVTQPYILVGPGGDYADFKTFVEDTGANVTAAAIANCESQYPDWATYVNLGGNNGKLFVFCNWTSTKIASVTSAFDSWSTVGDILIQPVPDIALQDYVQYCPGAGISPHIGGNAATVNINHRYGNITFKNISYSNIYFATATGSGNTRVMLLDACTHYSNDVQGRMAGRASTDSLKLHVKNCVSFRDQTGIGTLTHLVRGAAVNDPNCVVEGLVSRNKVNGSSIAHGVASWVATDCVMVDSGVAGSICYHETSKTNCVSSDATGNAGLINKTATDCFVNPNFDDFDVQPAAFLIGAGSDSGLTLGDTDYYGVTRSNDTIGALDNSGGRSLPSLTGVTSFRAVGQNTPRFTPWTPHLDSNIPNYNDKESIFFGDYGRYSMGDPGWFVAMCGGHGGYNGPDVPSFSPITLKWSIATNSAFDPTWTGTVSDHGGIGPNCTRMYAEIPWDATEEQYAAFISHGDGHDGNLNNLAKVYAISKEGVIQPVAGDSSESRIGSISRAFIFHNRSARYALIWLNDGAGAVVQHYDFTQPIGSRLTTLVNPSLGGGGNASGGSHVMRVTSDTVTEDEAWKLEPTGIMVMRNLSPYTETVATPDASYTSGPTALSAADIDSAGIEHFRAEDTIYICGQTRMSLLHCPTKAITNVYEFNGKAGGMHPGLACPEITDGAGATRAARWSTTHNAFWITGNYDQPIVMAGKTPLNDNIFHTHINALEAA